MASEFNDNIFSASPKLLDAKWGPFADTTEAYAAVPRIYREIGMFAIISPPSGPAQLYWYKNDIDNLVPFTGNSSVEVYDTFSNFPPIADASTDVIYIAKDTTTSYYFNSTSKEYVPFEGTSSVEIYPKLSGAPPEVAGVDYFPTVGVENIIYIADDTNISYIWNPTLLNGNGNYEILTGAGKGITSIERTSGDGSPGTTDTYTITYSDTTTYDFFIYNGSDGADGADGTNGLDGINGIDGIDGIDGINGLDGLDGNGISSITWTSSTGGVAAGIAGATDTYTITYTDSTTSTFDVYNGTNGVGGGGISYYVDGGTTNTYSITTGNSLTTNTTGDTYLIKFKSANTGASTLNVDGIGNVSILDSKTQANLLLGDIILDSVHLVVYTRTVFEVLTIGGGTGIGDMLKSTYDVDNDGVVDSAERTMFQAKNGYVTTLTKGTIVYLKTSSSDANYPEVLKANASTEAGSSKTIGAVYEDIAPGEVGYIITNGRVHNLNTDAYSVGQKLWLSTTDGGVTTTPPTQPNHTVFIGTVTRKQINNGGILYAIQNGFELEELHNVSIASVADNNGLFYENSTSLWKNKSISTVLGYTPQAQLNGTGFVKASGTTISYDNSTYLTAAITSLGGLTGATQTFATGTAGTDFGISPSGTTHTFNLPIASGANTGKLSSTDWGIFNNKENALTFSSPLSRTTNTISIPAANSGANGYLTSTDWSTFNNKQPLLQSGVNIKTINTVSLLGSGNLTISGTTPSTLTSLGAATGDNAGNTNHALSTITWNWNSNTTANAFVLASAGLTTGNLFDLTITSLNNTGAKALNILVNGGTNSSNTYGGYISNVKTGNGTNNALYLNASGSINNYGLIVNSGYSGFYTTSPTAIIHIGSTGVTASIPHLILAGSLVTPQPTGNPNGSIWYATASSNSSLNLYKDTSVTKIITKDRNPDFATGTNYGVIVSDIYGNLTKSADLTALGIFSQTTAVSANVASSNDILTGTIVGSKILPSDFFVAGKCIRIIVQGTISTTSTPNFVTFSLNLGSTLLVSTGSITTVANSGTRNFVVEFFVTCRTSGSSGTFMSSVNMMSSGDNTASGGFPFVNNFISSSPPTGSEINTSTTQTINMFISQTQANTISVIQVCAYYLN